MTIKVTKTQTVEEEREITLPYYCKLEDKVLLDTYYMVNEDESVVTVKLLTDTSLFSIQRLFASVFNYELGKAEPITKEEFDAAFNQAMNQLRQYQKEAV